MLMHEKTCVIPIVVSRFCCMALFHSQTPHHVIIICTLKPKSEDCTLNSYKEYLHAQWTSKPEDYTWNINIHTERRNRTIYK